MLPPLTHRQIEAFRAVMETGKVTPVAPAALAYKQQKMAQRQLAGQPGDAATVIGTR